jgi:hypothetical protein
MRRTAGVAAASLSARPETTTLARWTLEADGVAKRICPSLGSLEALAAVLAAEVWKYYQWCQSRPTILASLLHRLPQTRKIR